MIPVSDDRDHYVHLPGYRRLDDITIYRYTEHEGGITMIGELMKKHSYTKYALAKKSGIPYTTVSDIVSGKTRLEKCETETVYRLAKALGTTVDALIRANIADRIEFAVFCIENVASRLHADASGVYKALKDSRIMDDYIFPNYEVLHTQGKEYIVDDILEVMKEEGVNL